MVVISLADAKKNLGFVTSTTHTNSGKKTTTQLLSEAFKALNKRK